MARTLSDTEVVGILTDLCAIVDTLCMAAALQEKPDSEMRRCLLQLRDMTEQRWLEMKEIRGDDDDG